MRPQRQQRDFPIRFTSERNVRLLAYFFVTLLLLHGGIADAQERGRARTTNGSAHIEHAGEDDPDDLGCGRGCVAPLANTLDTYFDKWAKAYKKITKNAELKSKLTRATDVLRDAANTGDFCTVDGVLKGLTAGIAGAQENGILKKNKKKVSAALAALTNMGRAAAVTGPPPVPVFPPPPVGMCTVDLYAQMSSGELAAPVGDSVITFPRLASVQLVAEGKPAGGTYAWSFKYTTPALEDGVLATNASFVGMGSSARWTSVARRTIVVTVTYTCPPGYSPATVTDDITLRVR